MAESTKLAVAPAEGEEAEYESDPEDALRPSAMRRREASDHEGEGEGSDGDGDEEGEPAQDDRRIGAVWDSDGEGGAPAYDDEEDNEYEEDVEGDEEGLPEEEVEVAAYDAGEHGGGVGRDDTPANGVDSCADGRGLGGEKGGYGEKDQPEGKESEPFAVSTAGAFYMHDDRFRENVGSRHSWRGGRRLWESKDEQKWVHDRFDDMNLRDAQNEEKRTSKRNFRGCGKSRVPNRGSMRGGRYDRSRAYDDGSGKSHDVALNTTTARQSPSTSNVKVEEAYLHDVALNTTTSSLNSASPPFYPSGSSNPDVPATLRRDAHTVNNSLNISHSVTEDNLLPSHTSATLRGAAIHDPLRQQGRLYVNDFGLVARKRLANLQLPSSASLPPISTTHSTQFKRQGKGFTVTGQANYQLTPSVSQLGRGSGSAQMQLPAVQQPVQTSIQPLLRVAAEQSVQCPSGGSQVSFPSQGQLTNSSEVLEAESPSESGKSKMPVVLNGKTSTQESGSGSLMYSLAHGDQGFPTTPALLPVMQFGGQHSGGLGVPAVGMALPGYVAQTQLGFGNSEMTWLPVLAGAAGGLAASYGPYIALAGSYCARSPRQTSSAIASRETSTTKTANIWKTPQRPEVVSDECGQRQNKPRRFSEMNFGQ